LIIHPLTTKQHRQPANPGNKTDDTDLAAMQRGAVNGFGLLEPPADPLSIRLQLLARHRRDLVEKSVALRSQMHEHLHAIMPGYSNCFEDIYAGSGSGLLTRPASATDGLPVPDRPRVTWRPVLRSSERRGQETFAEQSHDSSGHRFPLFKTAPVAARRTRCPCRRPG
jgi:Transposase